MFQYAFAKALAHKNNYEILFDINWFEKSKNGEFYNTTHRTFLLPIFPNIKLHYASKQQLLAYLGRNRFKPIINDATPFEYTPQLLKNIGDSYYIGYFQNEQYFKHIQKEIKHDFAFPPLSKNDTHNLNILNRIKNCENPIFIHIRRGDYITLGHTLELEYYQKAVNLICQKVKNPTFFVFGIECADYIKTEFNINTPFEYISDINSQNEEDWKDLYLMSQCKHAIIANSSFSWWAAYLADNKHKIVIAPTPWMNGEDSIVCKNWIKIKR